MDCTESKESGNKQSNVDFETTQKDRDSLTDSSNSSSSCSSDLSQEMSLDSNIFQSNSVFEFKSDAVESSGIVETPENSTHGSLSRKQSRKSSNLQSSGVLGYHDPNRIPGSIFSAKSSNPEWSVASNESLFSIHVGNTSFSRDQYSLLTKSGELLLNAADFPYQPPNNMHLFVETAKVENKTESTTGNNLGQLTTSNGSQFLDTSSQKPADHNKGLTSPVIELRNSNVSGRSHESLSSIRSFQFPVLGGDGTRTSSVVTDSSAQQQTARQSVGDQPISPKPTPPSPTAKDMGWLSCFSWCRRN